MRRHDGDLIAGIFVAAIWKVVASEFPGPAVASQLTFVTHPASSKAGVSLSSFVVETKDQFGNVVTTPGTSLMISDNTLSGTYVTATLGKTTIAN